MVPRITNENSVSHMVNVQTLVVKVVILNGPIIHSQIYFTISFFQLFVFLVKELPELTSKLKTHFWMNLQNLMSAKATKSSNHFLTICIDCGGNSLKVVEQPSVYFITLF